jgi:hypothetical protein
MIDTYAKSLDTGYARAIDQSLAKQAKPGETRYERCLYPQNNAISEGQTSLVMYLTMNTSARSKWSNSQYNWTQHHQDQYKSTIMDYVKLVSSDQKWSKRRHRDARWYAGAARF